MITPFYEQADLPEELADVVVRVCNDELVYGFELHLFAQYVSS